MGKYINDDTKIIYNEEENSITFVNEIPGGSTYINTIYLKEKQGNKGEQEECPKEK